ncbi:putative hydro-lyase [Roseixanthobacter pseudopolyaromaticivorans]|uniref:putative hydro-lyase n=1 Tax=Xanthobacteraceae TaxID=335928 RepID=UPI00372ACD28
MCASRAFPPPFSTPADARAAIRAADYAGPTSAMARGHVQANIVILPRQHAADFLRFCQLNPKPCPLLEMGQPGDPALPGLGADIDMRSDLSAYDLIENGEHVATVSDIREYWSQDLVTFAMGCSFSFEEALEDAGLGVRHNELGLVGPMYTTNVPTRPVGAFGGPHIVTMRPYTPAKAIRAIQITGRFPGVHGAPIHFGDPAAIGIESLDAVEYGGDQVPIHADEVPVFWACGVTSRRAVESAKLPFFIAHKPAHMLITDRRNAEMAVF